MEGGNRWRERWVAASQRRCLLIVAVFALQVHGQAQPTHPQDAGIAAPPRTSNLATRAGQQNGGRTGFAARRLAEAEEEGDGRGASASEGFLESCAWLDALPRDFSSATDVNLDRYGGKQDEDGGVDLHGMQFRVPEPGASGERIVTAKIKVRVPSVLKIKCLSPTPGVSCDVRVAEGDGSDSYGLLHVGGAAAGTVLLPLLNPVTSGRRHVIRLVFSVPAGTKKGACLPFEFQSVMRPASSVRDELRCPPTLPVPALPQRKFSVGSEGTGLHFASDQFMITPDMLKLYKRSDASFVYPMSLHVKTGEVMLSVQASFDWILGDISVELARIRDDDLAGSDGHILFKSNETESEDQNAQFEKTTKLLATVPAGKYRLLIRDKTTSALRAGVVAAPTLSEEGAGDQEANRKLCVRFAFNIDAEPSGSMHLAPATPHNEKLLVPPDQPDGVHENRAVLLAVEPATAQNLDPTQPLRMVLSFSTPLAIFGKDGDGTPDAGRGGEEGTTEVHCSSGGGRRSWVGSSLCSTVFTLQPSGVNQQREPLGVAGHLGTSSRSNGPRRTSLTPATVYLRAGNSAQVVITWSAASLVEGVEYVLHIQQDYLKTQEGARVSVGAHNGGVHMYRAAACNCHGHGRCDVERRCACAAGYAGDDCQRCSEGNSLNDQGVCEKVKSTLVCSRNSCNGHGSVSVSRVLNQLYILLLVCWSQLTG